MRSKGQNPHALLMPMCCIHQKRCYVKIITFHKIGYFGYVFYRLLFAFLIRSEGVKHHRENRCGDKLAKARKILARKKAVTSIHTVTRTMEMVSTARFRRAFKRAGLARKYIEGMSQLVILDIGGTLAKLASMVRSDEELDPWTDSMSLAETTDTRLDL